MKKILLLVAFCSLCFSAVFFDDCYNDCYKTGLQAKPKIPLKQKDKIMFNSVYNTLSNEDYSK